MKARANKPEQVSAWDYVEDDPKLPRVLIIGDSISRAYTVPVRSALAGKANDVLLRGEIIATTGLTTQTVRAPSSLLVDPGCDYLRMSPCTLHRFSRDQAGSSPGAYFRLLKTTDARRLICPAWLAGQGNRLSFGLSAS